MSNSQNYKVIWCHKCDEPTLNKISYKGTKIVGHSVYAVFYSECAKCKFNNISEKNKNEILLSDYNALMTKQIYAYS